MGWLDIVKHYGIQALIIAGELLGTFFINAYMDQIETFLNKLRFRRLPKSLRLGVPWLLLLAPMGAATLSLSPHNGWTLGHYLLFRTQFLGLSPYFWMVFYGFQLVAILVTIGLAFGLNSLLKKLLFKTKNWRTVWEWSIGREKLSIILAIVGIYLFSLGILSSILRLHTSGRIFPDLSILSGVLFLTLVASSLFLKIGHPAISSEEIERQKLTLLRRFLDATCNKYAAMRETYEDLTGIRNDRPLEYLGKVESLLREKPDGPLVTLSGHHSGDEELQQILREITSVLTEIDNHEKKIRADLEQFKTTTTYHLAAGEEATRHFEWLKAAKHFEMCPGRERETGNCFAKAGRNMEAIRYYEKACQAEGEVSYFVETGD